MDVDVQLQPRDPSALSRLVTEVSTPGDPRFRQYVASGAFAGEFGPTPTALATVTRWLVGEGLDVDSVSSNHLTVQVTASAATLDRAMSVALERVRLPGGRLAYANARAPLLSAAVRPLVEGVIGLDDLVVPQWLGTRSVVPSLVGVGDHGSVTGPQACTAATTVAKRSHAYEASQLASSYNLTSLYAAGDEGAGITIALFEQETDLSSDIAAYESCYGIDPTITYIPVDGGSGGVMTNGEAAEDIEVAMGLAPKANLDVFQAPGSFKGALDDYTAMADRDTAQVISTSWGQCESQTGSSLLSAEATVFEQAAVQGQSVFAASGDDGSSDCATRALAVDDPASQPDVTGVGGTKVTAIGPPPAEVVWNESATSSGAGGGGLSSAHRMPSYQSSAPSALHVLGPYSSGVPCSAPKGSYCREVPDVSADADYSTGYLIYYDGRWESNGGTSAAAPLWAALAALADGSKSCDSKSIGFANPALYEAAATSYGSDFHDVTSGTNDDTNWGYTGGLYPAGARYDMASGLGTPNGGNLAKTLCDDAHVTVEPSTTTLALQRTSVAYGSETAETFTVHVTGKRGDGRPVGSILVFNVARRLCSHSLAEDASDQAVGRCSLSASSLSAGRHAVYAVFDPNVGSSSDLRYHYKSSRSKSSTVTIKK